MIRASQAARGAALLAALALSGCAVVIVKADGGNPRLSAWPLGVRVDRGSSRAMGVKQLALGLSESCFSAAVGVTSSFCVVIDGRTCTAAIVDGHADPAAKGWLNNIVSQAEAHCVGRMEISK